MTLGYSPMCALLGVPAIVAMPQAFVAALVPVIGIWFDNARYQAVVFLPAEMVGVSAFGLLLGVVTVGITYANALLPLLIWKTARAFPTPSPRPPRPPPG